MQFNQGQTANKCKNKISPHATISLTENPSRQIQGYQNARKNIQKY